MANKTISVHLSVLSILVSLLVLFYITLYKPMEREHQNRDKRELEKAYFEGQKDALNKDIRIFMEPDGTWVWIKSPWDEGILPDTLIMKMKQPLTKE